jgi:hypothetical protein
MRIALKGMLGQVSFGTVYAGVWREQQVAVKVILHPPSATARVESEVKLVFEV